jgi:hypothetical protein
MSSGLDDLIFGLPRRPLALARQRESLEVALREFLFREGFETVFFYPAPRSAKVTFRNKRGAYWTAESRLPEHLNNLSRNDIEDWLYGDFVSNRLPAILHDIRRVS